MKKVFILSIVFVIAFSSPLFAQKTNTSWNGKGTVVVNAGYGIGSIWKQLFKLSGTKVSATGPLALGFEYGVSEKIGVGVQLSYSKITGTTPISSYISTETLTAFNALARANYHFAKSDKFDPYVGIGLGFGSFKYVYKDTDPAGNPTSTFGIPGSFVFSGALGARYFFTNQIGVYTEVGYLSGSVVQVGLVAKF
jgi:opacity protein-like surface antigen